VRANPVALDAIANFLIERGSPGVVIKKNEVRAYFARAAAGGSIGKELQRFLGGIRGFFPRADRARLRWSVVKDENWSRSWRRFIKPQKVGKSFWVTPPWASPPKLRRRRVITIEPGMAFGTGTHATTRGCLELIEQAAARLGGRPFTALDLGTGSGILSIALALLGATKVRALDNDPVALRVARENLCLNGVEKKVQLSGTALLRIRKSFTLVVANLTAPTILDLADALVKKVAPKGFLVLSGILHHQAGAVIRRFAADRFIVVRRKRGKEWVTMLLKRR